MRFLRAFALAASLASPALAGNVTSFVLDNGLEVVVIEDHRAPVVVQMVWYRAGAADEKPGVSGVAHFLEHLMFKGTKEVAPGAFSKTVAANGGSDNAFTAWDYTAYYQRIASDRLELVMKMEADRMRNLTLSEDDWKTEREVIIEERNQRTDSDPGAIFGEQRRAALEDELRQLRQQASQPSPELLARERRLEETSKLLDARQEWLQQSEAHLAELQEEIEHLHQELLDERRRLREEAQAERQEIDAMRRRELAELDEKRLALQRRSEQLDQGRAALHQMREDVGRLHRETLENRLVAEELTARLSAGETPAETVRALDDLRAALAGQYREEQEDLARRRDELTALGAQLAEQYQRLVRQREEFERWAVRRQEELERLCAGLLEREEALERREVELQTARIRSQAERLEAVRSGRPPQPAAA
jgi:DNA repair exonuclease SbcCD ATPase subunit